MGMMVEEELKVYKDILTHVQVYLEDTLDPRELPLKLRIRKSIAETIQDATFSDAQYPPNYFEDRLRKAEMFRDEWWPLGTEYPYNKTRFIGHSPTNGGNMLHNECKLDPEAHWAVARNTYGETLIQIQDKYGDQARIRLTQGETLEVIKALIASLDQDKQGGVKL